MYSSRQSTCEKKLAGKYAGLPVSSFWQLRQQRPPGGARRPLPFVEPTSLPFRSRGDLSSPTREPYFANSANEAQLSANIVTKKDSGALTATGVQKRWFCHVPSWMAFAAYRDSWNLHFLASLGEKKAPTPLPRCRGQSGAPVSAARRWGRDGEGTCADYTTG